jgi:hypothetical protein
MIGKNINFLPKVSLGCCEMRMRRPWFDERCSKLLAGKKQAKLRRIQYPNEMVGDDMDNISRRYSSLAD